MPKSDLSNGKEIFGFIPSANLMQFSLVTMLFLIWGIPNNLNDILIPQFMKSFELNRFQASLVQFAFYMGYFLIALPSALFMRRFSYKAGLVTGLFLFSFGCFLFWPAAIVGKYGLFLGALFVIACGLTFLETGANLFIVVLGREQTAERRLNFSQAFNPIGSILGAYIGTRFIFSGIENDPAKIASMKAAGTYAAYLHSEILRIVMPYLVLAAFALIWGILILVNKFPKVRDDKEEEAETKPPTRKAISELFSGRFPHFTNGLISQFLYVAAQVCTWSFFIQYIKDYTGASEKFAGKLLIGTLVMFLAGRFSATWFMRWQTPQRLMGIYCLINIGLVVLAIAFPGWIGVWAVFMTSFFMSVMYPTNFALAVRDLGPLTKIGGSIMVMTIGGGALFPPLMGKIAEVSHSLAFGMIIPLIAYGYVGWYAYKGAGSSLAGNASLPRLSGGH
jgi:FHS family L-fucose permease-like MFS transporter